LRKETPGSLKKRKRKGMRQREGFFSLYFSAGGSSPFDLQRKKRRRKIGKASPRG